MARYPMKPVPFGYFVTPVTLTDGREVFVAGRVLYGDDEGDGEVVDLYPFVLQSRTGPERRVRVFRQRDEAVGVCEVMRDNQRPPEKIE